MIPLVAAITAVITGGALALPAQSAAPMVDYQGEVHPILAENCVVCHNQEKRSGGLSLVTYEDILGGGRSGAAIKPGLSEDSLLVDRVTGEIEPRMPLGKTLGEAEIVTIRFWIDQGARRTPTAAPAKAMWEPKLSLERPAVPEQVWKDWSQPLDRFAAKYLSGHEMNEPELVFDAVFARRAYLDVWGLLPDPAELRTFLEDKAPDKRRQLVAKLLADNEKYSEHWISYWNDLLRNDEGVNYYSQSAGRKSISPWLLHALETNTPYDQMVSKLLNPRQVGDPDGFLTGVNWRGTVSAGQTQAIQAAQNTAQIFMGVNLKCNSCHDSFISRWKLKDAYGLAAYFSDEERLRLYRCDAPQDEYAKASFLYPELNRPLPSMKPEDRRAIAAEIFTDPRNGRFARTLVNRFWEKLSGRGIVENSDEMDGEPWSPELLDWLASDFVSSGHDLKHLIATIINSRAYQMPAVPRGETAARTFVFEGPEVRRLTAEQFADAVASITGDWRAVQNAVTGRAAGDGQDGGTLELSVSGTPRDGSALKTDPFAGSRGRPGGGRDDSIRAGSYTREWRTAGNNLTRALGRPIRDQVFSTRQTRSTTIQAVELANGELLTSWLWRGARKLLGELPPEPKSLMGKQVRSGRGGQAFTPFEIDVSNSEKLYLIVEDTLSTAPDKAYPVWAGAQLSGPNGSTPLSALKPESDDRLRQGSGPAALGDETHDEVLRVKFPALVIYDIAGKGFTRFSGVAGFEKVDQLLVGETVSSRFYVFDLQPSFDRLTPPQPGTPLPPPPLLTTVPETVSRVYWHALGRAPSAEERSVAERALHDPEGSSRPSAKGLADLLWAVLMTPEFQLIR